MTTVTIPVSLGGTGTPYTDGTGLYGMASKRGYGYNTYLMPMLSEVMAACAVVITNATNSAASATAAASSASAAAASAAAAAASAGVGGLLTNEAANVVAQRNGSNPQTYRLYNNFTDASNYARSIFDFSGGGLRITTQAAGTFAASPLSINIVPQGAGTIIRFGSAGSGRLVLGATGHLEPDSVSNTYDLGSASTTFRSCYFGTHVQAPRVRTTPLTVATLPSAATVGAGTRAFVTDANATTFASVVAGGGANGVPVYSDGTSWRIG